MANNSLRKRAIGLPYELAAGGTSLFGQIMCTGTPTYAAATDLHIKLHLLQD
jgi:hypothetical protein